jgi:hypothetical protein
MRTVAVAARNASRCRHTPAKGAPARTIGSSAESAAPAKSAQSEVSMRASEARAQAGSGRGGGGFARFRWRYAPPMPSRLLKKSVRLRDKGGRGDFLRVDGAHF